MVENPLTTTCVTKGRYTLSSPDVHTTIVGTANPDHLEAVGRGPLPQEIRTAVDQRLNRLPA